MNATILTVAALFLVIGQSSTALGKIYFSPYVSISSTKSLTPSDDGEDSKTDVRQTAGIRAGISFWRLLSLQLEVGQENYDHQEKKTGLVDEFDEIDYEQDLDLSTDDPDATVDISEQTNKARFQVVLDPSFWIFKARAKFGVQAKQRNLSVTDKENTENNQDLVTPILYDPLAGVGLGVRMGRYVNAMAEYTFVFHKYPEIEPFEREVSISLKIKI